MQVLILASNELKLLLRNKMMFSIILLMPIVMIALMGYALKPLFETGLPSERFTVLYLNQDKGPVGEALDNFLHTEGAKYFTLLPVTAQQLAAEVRDEKYPIAVNVPPDLSVKSARSESVAVEVITGQKDPLRTELVMALVSGFVDKIDKQNALAAVYRQYTNNGEPATALFPDPPGDFTVLHKVGLNSRLSSFQFFAASMLVFFLLTTGMGVGVNLINERTDRIYLRISSFPVTKSQYLLGRVLCNLLTGGIQAIVVIVFTKYVFQVHWGTNVLGLAVTTCLIILLSCGLGIVFSTLFNSAKVLSVAQTMVLWFMTFLSGGFTVKPVLGRVGDFTPNKWAFDALTRLMLGQSLVEIAPKLIPLGIVCLVLWSIGITAYQRRDSHA